MSHVRTYLKHPSECIIVCVQSLSLSLPSVRTARPLLAASQGNKGWWLNGSASEGSELNIICRVVGGKWLQRLYTLRVHTTVVPSGRPIKQERARISVLEIQLKTHILCTHRSRSLYIIRARNTSYSLRSCLLPVSRLAYELPRGSLEQKL